MNTLASLSPGLRRLLVAVLFVIFACGALAVFSHATLLEARSANDNSRRNERLAAQQLGQTQALDREITEKQAIILQLQTIARHDKDRDEGWLAALDRLREQRAPLSLQFRLAPSEMSGQFVFRRLNVQAEFRHESDLLDFFPLLEQGLPALAVAQTCRVQRVEMPVAHLASSCDIDLFRPGESLVAP